MFHTCTYGLQPRLGVDNGRGILDKDKRRRRNRGTGEGEETEGVIEACAVSSMRCDAYGMCAVCGMRTETETETDADGAVRMVCVVCCVLCEMREVVVHDNNQEKQLGR